MTAEKRQKYNASFTTGALMLHESRVLIPLLLNADTEGVRLEKEQGVGLKINSLQARRKKIGEISKRFRHAKRSVWERFVIAEEQEQLLILYYATLKSYDLLKDFQIDVLLKKWLNYSLDCDKYVFLDFLFRQSGTHSEINDWTDITKDKLAQIVNLMLSEVGLLKNGKIRELNVKNETWAVFASLREYWFLEALFLDAEQRETIKQAL